MKYRAELYNKRMFDNALVKKEIEVDESWSEDQIIAHAANKLLEEFRIEAKPMED